MQLFVPGDLSVATRDRFSFAAICTEIRSPAVAKGTEYRFCRTVISALLSTHPETALERAASFHRDHAAAGRTQ